MRFNGRELAPPLTIVRRLIALPLIFIFRVALCGAVWLGYGRVEAESYWCATK